MSDCTRFEFIRLTHISGMGDVLVYRAVMDDGTPVAEEGMISIDKKWLKPCTMNNHNYWHKIEEQGEELGVILSFKHKEVFNSLDEKVIKLVDDFLFEKEVLSEE